MEISGRFRLALLALIAIGSLTIPAIASATPCTNNWAGGVCTGSITYTTATTLSNDVWISGGITINSGQTLTTNGFNLMMGGNFVNSGTLATGVNALTGGTAGNTDGTGAGANSVYGVYVQAANIIGGTITATGQSTPPYVDHSGGASGGGFVLLAYSNQVSDSATVTGGTAGFQASSSGSGTAGASGGATLARGGTNSGTCTQTQATKNGATPSAPTVTNANIVTWSGSWVSYFSAGAGGGTSYTSSGGNGASYTSSYAGSGGAGSSNCSSSNSGAGNGGNGQVATYNYGSTQPLATPGSPVAGPGLTIATNPVAYGQTDLLTANAVTPGDSVALQYCKGSGICTAYTQIASGTSMATNNICYDGTWNTCWAVGTYNVIANDITAATLSSAILTVTKANTIEACTYNSIPITAGSTINSLLASPTIACSFPSVSSQVTNGILYKGGASVAGPSSVPSYTLSWDNQADAFVGNSVTGGNYLGNSISFTINSLPYTINTITVPSTAYETQTNDYIYNLNITKAATSANAVLTVNNIFTQNQLKAISPTNEIWTFPYISQLIATNNVAMTFNANLFVTLANGMVLNEGQVNTIQTSQLWNYIPGASAAPANIVLGSNVVVNTVITQPVALGLATVNGLVQVGNTLYTESITSPYNYQAALYSFINQVVNVPMPTLGNPQTVTANSIVQLGFDGNSIYRNTPTTFSTYLPAVLTCNALSNVNAIGWTFYNGLEPSAPWNPNVLISGAFVPSKQLYTGNTIPGTSGGFTGSATANTYSTCIYPTWGQFNITGSFTYSSAGTASSGYILNHLGISNVIDNLKLYLNVVALPIQYEIAVQNVTTLTYIPAVIQVLQYDANTATAIPVSQLQTTLGTGAFIQLNETSFYKFIALSPTTNQTLAVTPYIQAAACASTPCLYTIYVGNATVSLPQTAFGDLNYGCMVVDGASNTATVACTFQSRSGNSWNTSLQVFQDGATGPIYNCQKGLFASGGSINCAVNSINTTEYTYHFNAQSKGIWYTIALGFFGTVQSLFEPDGLYIAFIFIISVFLLFVTRNVNVAIIMFDAAWIVSNLVGLLYMPAYISGFLIFATAVALYIINRQ